MNKIKFLFAAVGVVAVGAAITASKAQIIDQIWITDTPGAECVKVHATLFNAGQPAVGTFFASTHPGECPNLVTIYQAL